MRNRSLLKFLLFASVVLNVSFISAAAYRYYSHSNDWVSPFGARMSRDHFIFEELSLSPEQLASLKQKAIPFRREIDGRMRRIIEKRKKVVELLRMDRPDQKALDAVITEISAMQQDMQRRIVAHMLEVKSSLDKEQQQKFLDLIEQRMAAGGMGGCPASGQGAE